MESCTMYLSEITDLQDKFNADESWKGMFDSIWKKKGNPFIQFLLDAGLEVNALNKYGKTMLSYAAEWGNLEIVKFLVQEGADVNMVNSDGSKPLHIAAMYGRQDIVKFFLNKGVSADSRDNDDFSPLHYVALAPELHISLDTIESYQETVRFLVDSNADLNAVNRKGCTPLLLAAKYHCTLFTRVFIELGARIEIFHESGFAPKYSVFALEWAMALRNVMERNINFNRDLTTSGDKPSLLYDAFKSHTYIIKLFINIGANVCFVDQDGWTVLHISCEHGWLDIVKYLGSKGCDLNVKNMNGCTPLVVAAANSHSDIVEYLIESGNLLNLDCVDGFGNNVLHYACRKGWVDIVKSLIKKGSSLHSRDIEGNTPLHCAVEAYNSKTIEHLLKAGANWNVGNADAETAFNKCISSSNFKGIVLFVENGAFFQSNDYNFIISKPLLKEGILQNVELCSQAVINQFNNSELRGFYEKPGIAERLPSIENMKIANNTKVARDIADSVKFEIETKGYCNPLTVHPNVLNMLCVRTFKIPL